LSNASHDVVRESDCLVSAVGGVASLTNESARKLVALDLREQTLALIYGGTPHPLVGQTMRLLLGRGPRP
jgi:hypothetical protein